MEMGDLISRKAMLEAIDELRPTLKSIREFVRNRPAVDAEPVRHGKWEHGMQCPFCKQIDTTKPNYCPNCGARMDGGEMDGYRDS